MTRPDDHARPGGADDPGGSGAWRTPGSEWGDSRPPGWGDDVYGGGYGGDYGAWSRSSGTAATGFLPPLAGPGGAGPAGGPAPGGRRGATPWLIALAAVAGVIVLVGGGFLLSSALRGGAAPASGSGASPGGIPETVTETATATATATATTTRTAAATGADGGSRGRLGTWGTPDSAISGSGFASGPSCGSGESLLLAVETEKYRAVICSDGSDAFYRGYARDGGLHSPVLAASAYATYGEDRAGGARVSRWEARNGSTTYRVSPNGITIEQNGSFLAEDTSTAFAVARDG